MCDRLLYSTKDTTRVNGHDKTFHVDMLQNFVPRPDDLVPETINISEKEGNKSTDDTLQASAAIVMGASSVAVINSFSPAVASMTHEEHDSVGLEDSNGLTNIIIPSLKQKETIYDIITCNSLDHRHTNEVKTFWKISLNFFPKCPI